MRCLHHLVLVCVMVEWSNSLMFRMEEFSDFTEDCRNSDGKPLTFILNEDTPAMYASVDPGYKIKTLKKVRRVDQTKVFNLAETRILQDLAMDLKRPWGNNASFNCVLQIQTELPKGDKTDSSSDALSLMIVELSYSSSSKSSNDAIEILTFGHEGHRKVKVTKPAHYSDRIWASTNPNFLLSGQLSGFESVDYRTKVDSQHIIRPEFLRSTFDKPASITVNITNWKWQSHVYMVFTSYKHLGHDQRCHNQKEFDCAPHTFLGAHYHLCMSSSLACDGLPNCGQDVLPNQDENCFKIHWSSVLLSLVSYILLAITLLLCLSCFARVLIQWSVRSSLAELRGIGSPTGSFRSSARFFSFLGNTFTSRWDRPPPTYDEAMKHVNPDIARPATEPPAYSNDPGNRAQLRLPLDSRQNQPQTDSRASGGIMETPPPEYDAPDHGDTQAQEQVPFLDRPLPDGSATRHPTVVILPPTPCAPLGDTDPLSGFVIVNEAASMQSQEEPLASISSSETTKKTTTTTVEAEICI